MARRHLEAETLARLAARDLDRGELEAVAWHLYKCARCRGRVRQAVPGGDRVLTRLFRRLRPTDVYGPKDYSSAFASVGHKLAGELDRRRDDRETAPDRLQRLLSTAPEERRELLDRDPSVVDWDVVVRLLEVCRGTWSERPAEAEELAGLALEACRRVDPGEAPEEPVRVELWADLEARCWAYLGNCRRIRADLDGSTRAFEQAREALVRGTGDDAERARILDMEASLLRYRRRFAASEEVLDEAARLYRRTGDLRGEARALIKLAITQGAVDDVERAVETGRRALALIGREAEPRLYLAATLNLLVDLYQLGGQEDLDERLEEARRLAERHGTLSDRRRLRWFEGVVARDRGRWEEAEELLRAVRREYVEDDLPYEAAVASMDLAILCLEQGRTAETRQLAREMLPIFESRDVQREALGALMLFQKTVLADDLTVAAARKITTAMRRGRSFQLLGGAPPS